MAKLNASLSVIGYNVTLREYAAVAAMQGQLAAQGPEVGEWSESAFPELARISVAIADALLARLEEKQ